MNRAWIPAGALAGVSVAGLIALGPLTDSLNTQVTFPTSIGAAQSTDPGKAAPASVPVSITIKGAAGDTSTAPLVTTTTRGGQSAALSTSSDAGQVAYKKFHSTSNSTNTTTTHTTSAKVATPPATPKKQTVKRQTTIIGTIGEQNGDSGLAGGSKGSTSLGGSTSTPGP